MGVLLNNPDTLQRREALHFSVVPVLYERQLGANRENILVVA
jgi:hypothetical protein